jgi:hypothetical protein
VPAVGGQLVVDGAAAAFLDVAAAPIVTDALSRQASAVAIYGAGPEGRAIARVAMRHGLSVARFVESSEGARQQPVDGLPVCGIDECVADGIDLVLVGSRRHADVMRQKTAEAAARQHKKIDILLPTEAPAGPWLNAFLIAAESPSRTYPELWRESCDGVTRQHQRSLRDGASFAAAFLMGFYWPSAAAMVLARTRRIPVPDPAPFVYSMQ